MKKKFVFVCCLLGTFCIGKNVKANHFNQYDKIYSFNDLKPTLYGDDDFEVLEENVYKTLKVKGLDSIINKNIVYKYNKKVEALIKDWDDYTKFYNAGSSVTFTTSFINAESKSYSDQISNEYSITYNRGLECGLEFDFFKFDVSNEVGQDFIVDYTKNKSVTYDKSIEKSQSYTYFVDKTGLYRFQERGLFNVYVFENVSEVRDIDVRHKTSKFAYYTLNSRKIVLEKDGTSIVGLFRHKYYNYELDIDKEQLEEIYGTNIISLH
jgi:hypothetical protein